MLVQDRATRNNLRATIKDMDNLRVTAVATNKVMDPRLVSTAAMVLRKGRMATAPRRELTGEGTAAVTVNLLAEVADSVSLGVLNERLSIHGRCLTWRTGAGGAAALGLGGGLLGGALLADAFDGKSPSFMH
jgi:hypothetical protein